MEANGDTQDCWILWLEVESVCGHFLQALVPSGIQRVALGLFGAWSDPVDGIGERVRLCRFDPDDGRFHEIPKGLFDEIVGSRAKTRPSTTGAAGPMPMRLRLERRFKLAYYGILHRLLGGSEHKLNKWRDRPDTYRLELALRELRDAAVSSADVVLFAGLHLAPDRYFERLAAAKRAGGFRIAWIVFDLAPYLRPEFFPPNTSLRFRRYVSELLACADLALCISQTTLRDLADFAAATGAARPEAAVIPLGGDGLEHIAPGERPRGPGPLRERPFVLITGTLEPRKNHVAAIETWRRLIARYGSQDMPDLVLAGRRGWLVKDTLALLASTNNLGGKVIHLPAVTDQELAALYRESLFTLYPSFYEGYGLPVAESLRYGKLCIASDIPSIREIGGDLVDYVDPEDLESICAAVERAIHDRDYRRAREADIKREHRRLSWGDSADCVMKEIVDLRRRTRAPGTADAPSDRAE